MDFVSALAEQYNDVSAQVQAAMPALPAPLLAAALDLDVRVAATAAQIGFPADQFKYVVCLFLAYPLAWIHRALPDSPTLKHLYSIFFGLTFGFFCFGSGMIHSFITAVLVYLIVLTVKGSLAPKLVFLVTIGHLSISHILRMYINYGGYELDYTGPQMVLVIKLTSFAYSVYDGTRLDKLHPDLKSRAIVKMPSLIEYFGFVYFFGSFLAGPAHEFLEYKQLCDLTLFEKDKDGQRRIPSTYWPAVRCMLTGIACYGGIHFSGQYPIKRLGTVEFLTATSFFERYVYLQLSCSLQRFQYYFVWLIAEGACIASGLGYNGKDAKGAIQWDRVNNVDVLGVEFAQNFKSVTDMWNRKTNSWLRYFVYMRLTPDNGKATFVVTMLTYLTSAFWHGFYAGYYMTFFSGALVTTVARSLRQIVRPYFLKADGKTGTSTKVIYDVIGWFVTMNTLNYICTSFVLLSMETSLRVYASLYYFIHVATIILLLLSYVVPVKKDRAPGATAKPAVAAGSAKPASKTD